MHACTVQPGRYIKGEEWEELVVSLAGSPELGCEGRWLLEDVCKLYI